MGLLPQFAYASLAQFGLTGIPSTATALVDPGTIQNALYATARTINGYLKSQFVLGQSPLPPLISWGDDITQLNIDLAVPIVMGSRGFNQDGADQRLVDARLKDAKQLCYEISRRIYVPDVVDYANPPDVAPSPQAYPMPSVFDVLAPFPGRGRF